MVQLAIFHPEPVTRRVNVLAKRKNDVILDPDWSLPQNDLDAFLAGNV